MYLYVKTRVKTNEWRDTTEKIDQQSASTWFIFSFFPIEKWILTMCWIWLDPIMQMFVVNASCHYCRFNLPTNSIYGGLFRLNLIKKF